VELGSIELDWKRLQARASRLVLHGREDAADTPLLSVDSATLGLRIISVFEKKVDLASLQIQGPKIHIILYPDGSTNIPGPQKAVGAPWSQQVLDLKVGVYDIAGGTLDYDNRKIPLNLHGENLRARLTYDAGTPSYRGDLSFDGLRAAVAQYGPFDTRVNATF